MRRLVRECFQNKKALPHTVLFEGNEGVLNLAYTDTSSEKTKHIPVKFFLCKEKVADGPVILKYIPSKENAADIFTKSLPLQEQKHLVLMMSMRQHPQASRLNRNVSDEGEC